MKKIIVLVLVMLFGAASLFAVDIDLTMPTINASGWDYSISSVTGLSAFEDVTNRATEVLSVFDSMDDLVKGMSNASSYATDGATTRDFIGYKIFSVAVGTMLSLQSSYGDNIDDIISKVEDSEDIYFGINAQAVTVSAGVNLGFLVDGLYLSGKVGKFAYGIDDFDIDTFSFGFMANYQIIKPKSAVVVKWKGLQVGTGFIYYTSEVSFKSNTSVSQEIFITDSNTGIEYSATAFFDPEAEAKFKTKGIKVPVELMTGIKIFVLDVSLGFGVDINAWSNSDLTYKAEGDAYLRDLPAGVASTPGYVKVSGGTTGKSADTFRFKAMAGLGLSLGPVKLDLPLTYYFDGEGTGANVGITGAVVF